MSPSPRSQRPAFHPVVAGAALLTVHGLFGAFLSGFLTVLKFRSAHSCDVALLSSCQIGKAFNCERVLTSPWSTFPDIVPISLYATSFYLVIVGLAASILARPASFGPTGRALLLAMASFGVLVIIPLALYAAFLGLCSYCLVIYLLSVALLLDALVMNPGGYRSAVAALRDRRTHRRTSIILISGLTFVAFTLVQLVAYLRGSAGMEAESQCVNQSGEAPETALVSTKEPAEVDVALFIDLACPTCRSEFATWKQDIAASGGRYRLVVYHFPREGECIPPGHTAYNRNSELNHSCLAARVVECFERFQPGRGLEVVERLFELQDVPKPPAFSWQNLAGVTDSLGLYFDPENDKDRFVTCVKSPSVKRRILEHARFAARLRFTETPAALFTFYEKGVPLDYTYRVKGAKQYPDVDEYIRSAREQALSQGVEQD